MKCSADSETGEVLYPAIQPEFSDSRLGELSARDDDVLAIRYGAGVSKHKLLMRGPGQGSVLLHPIIQCGESLSGPVSPDYLRGVGAEVSPHQYGGVVRCDPGAVVLPPLLELDAGGPGVVSPLETGPTGGPSPADEAGGRVRVFEPGVRQGRQVAGGSSAWLVELHCVASGLVIGPGENETLRELLDKVAVTAFSN